MANNASIASALLRPEQVGDRIIEPLSAASVAMTQTRVVQTDSAEYRIPVVEDDADADWVGENDEIPESEATGRSIKVTPQKVAGLASVSNEAVSDTSPEAHQEIADGLARKIARKVDRALFGRYVTLDTDPDYNEDRPAGLESIALDRLTHLDADPLAVSLDAFIDADSEAEELGVEITSWITTKNIKRGLRKLKSGSGANSYLLDYEGRQLTLLGAPVIASPFVTAGSVWGLPKSRVRTVLRKDVSVAFDKSYRFNRDQTSVRATARLAFGFPSPESIVLIRKS